MVIMRRIVDFFLLLFVISWFNWLLALLPESVSPVYRLAVVLNYVYYSLNIVFALMILLLGGLALSTLILRWQSGFYWQHSAVETCYLFAAIIFLTGFFRLLFVGGGRGYGTDPLWLTSIILWMMFGGWFWLYRTIKPFTLARALYSSIYTLLIAVVAPLAATAFSFLQLSPPPGLFRIKMGIALLIGTGICFLLIIRVYTHCLKIQRLSISGS
ncbi:MAG: hypothetical protein ACLFN5_00925 [bacterium]